jgi:AcrR family transcriptional regulator
MSELKIKLDTVSTLSSNQASRAGQAASDTRLRILEATWRLLEDSRGLGARMSDIAAAAGVSRQALYLHFASRAELLVATTRHVDEVHGVQERLAQSRAQVGGVQRLDAYVAFWGDYLPRIHGVVRAILLVRDTDSDAATAWDDRMRAHRAGCRAAVEALRRDGLLAPLWTLDTATDVLWALLSVRQWELLTIDCGWSQTQYVQRTQALARHALRGSPSAPSPARQPSAATREPTHDPTTPVRAPSSSSR